MCFSVQQVGRSLNLIHFGFAFRSVNRQDYKY
jgi:hypothetical protein